MVLWQRVFIKVGTDHNQSTSNHFTGVGKMVAGCMAALSSIA
jgi:hypothetical protein